MSEVTLQANEKEVGAKRLLITFSVMLATIMQALDTTIANVALPHMQGSMGATQDRDLVGFNFLYCCLCHRYAFNRFRGSTHWP